MNKTLIEGADQTNFIQGHILIADDHDETTRLIAMMLRMMGYPSQATASVVEAQTCLQRGGVALVLTDWFLPDGTGLDVCCAARAIRENLPVVVMSGLYDENNAHITNCKPDAYLKKPIDMAVLETTLHRLLHTDGRE